MRREAPDDSTITPTECDLEIAGGINDCGDVPGNIPPEHFCLGNQDLGVGSNHPLPITSSLPEAFGQGMVETAAPMARSLQVRVPSRKAGNTARSAHKAGLRVCGS